MAYVYLGHDTTLDRSVAIKILKQSLSRDKAFADQFHHEAKAAANLTHPNIVTVHDFGFDNTKLFIIMEFVAGYDLQTTLIRQPSITLYEILQLLIQACDGIGFAHKAGIIHCDLKPQNLLVTHDHKLKVTDFGIARAVSAATSDSIQNLVWGSPHYFSPEQSAGYPPTPASDVYSLGVVLFEALTGILPFESVDNTELARMHQEVLPPRPRSINPMIPAMLEQVMIKLLSKDPSTRYRTADQLAIILRNIARENPQLAKSIRTVPASTIPGDLDKGLYHRFMSSVKDLDWGTIALAILSTLAVGGLIPFWFYVWLSMNGY